MTLDSESIHEQHTVCHLRTGQGLQQCCPAKCFKLQRKFQIVQNDPHNVCQVRSGEVANFINIIGKRIDWQAQQ